MKKCLIIVFTLITLFGCSQKDNAKVASRGALCNQVYTKEGVYIVCKEDNAEIKAISIVAHAESFINESITKIEKYELMNPIHFLSYFIDLDASSATLFISTCLIIIFVFLEFGIQYILLVGRKIFPLTSKLGINFIKVFVYLVCTICAHYILTLLYLFPMFIYQYNENHNLTQLSLFIYVILWIIVAITIVTAMIKKEEIRNKKIGEQS